MNYDDDDEGGGYTFDDDAEALEVIEALLEQADMGEVDEETQAIVDKARSVIIKAKGE